MPKLTVKQKNWLLSAHVAFAALWTGTVVSMFLLALRNQHSADAEVLQALNSAINLLDDYVVIPSAIGSLLTGTLLCWLTIWGFFKHYWVIAKWIATVVLIVFGTFWLFPWANAATAISSSQRLQALENPLYTFDAKGVLIGTVVQVVCLVVIIAVSLLKPWGRRIVKELLSDKISVRQLAFWQLLNILNNHILNNCDSTNSSLISQFARTEDNRLVGK